MREVSISRKWLLVWLGRLGMICLFFAWFLPLLLRTVAWLLLALLFYLCLRYSRYRVLFDEECAVIEFQSIYSVRRRIRFDSLQHVAVISSPFQRILGLRTVVLSGVGTVSALPCLRLLDAEEIAAAAAAAFERRAGQTP